MKPEEFLENVQNLLGFDLHRIAELDEKEIQKKLGPALRELAVEYLRYSQDDSAAAFRYRFDTPEIAKKYLDEMAKDRAWGEDMEAIALASIFRVNLNAIIHVAVPNAAGDDWVETETPHKLFTLEDAPTITLNNRENTHWYVNGATGSDGNCLFYSMAQALQNQVRIALQQIEQANDLSDDGLTDHESITPTGSPSNEEQAFHATPAPIPRTMTHVYKDSLRDLKGAEAGTNEPQKLQDEISRVRKEGVTLKQTMTAVAVQEQQLQTKYEGVEKKLQRMKHNLQVNTANLFKPDGGHLWDVVQKQQEEVQTLTLDCEGMKATSQKMKEFIDSNQPQLDRLYEQFNALQARITELSNKGSDPEELSKHTPS